MLLHRAREDFHVTVSIRLSVPFAWPEGHKQGPRLTTKPDPPLPVREGMVGSTSASSVMFNFPSSLGCLNTQGKYAG